MLSVRQNPPEDVPMNDQSATPSQHRFFSAPLAETDPELADAIGAELARQQDGIEILDLVILV